jgi:predicted transcriptional regulator YdeE
MAQYEMRTKNGHSFFDMIAMLQKAIRRGDYAHAGYAASELWEKYRNYLWNRLLIISAEDCFGILTKEILALWEAEKQTTKKGESETIFISKAICLICYARKNRDADYFACNLMHSDTPIPEDQIEHVPIEELKLDAIPEYSYDVFTWKGKKAGKDMVDMIVTEQKNLTPHQPSLFDDEDWSRDIKACLGKFNPKNRPVEGVDWSQHGGSAGKQFPSGARLPAIAGRTTVAATLVEEAALDDSPLQEAQEETPEEPKDLEIW